MAGGADILFDGGGKVIAAEKLARVDSGKLTVEFGDFSQPFDRRPASNDGAIAEGIPALCFSCQIGIGINLNLARTILNDCGNIREETKHLVLAIHFVIIFIRHPGIVTRVCDASKIDLIRVSDISKSLTQSRFGHRHRRWVRRVAGLPVLLSQRPVTPQVASQPVLVCPVSGPADMGQSVTPGHGRQSHRRATGPLYKGPEP